MGFEDAQLYDAHIHLSDPEYDPIMTHVMKSMDALDIAACCVSTNIDDSHRTVDLAKRYDRVAAFVGIHPDSADKNDPDEIKRIVDKNPNVIRGIGEIGLDPTVTDEDGYKRQRPIFESMLALAEKKNLPVSIHTRKSLEDVLEIISSYKLRTLLHWFDGNKRQLARAMDMGLYVSYGPVSVYAKDKQSLIARTDQSLILSETDGPVRFSRCFEHDSAQPSHIPSVVHCIAQSQKTTYDRTQETLADNLRQYMGIRD